eukprot:m.119417 g.119417  ORF g.119417 m.119417 type:complete len:593 (-) comp14315_c0_seq3:1527-3305(-)
MGSAVQFRLPALGGFLCVGFVTIFLYTWKVHKLGLPVPTVPESKRIIKLHHLEKIQEIHIGPGTTEDAFHDALSAAFQIPIEQILDIVDSDNQMKTNFADLQNGKEYIISTRTGTDTCKTIPKEAKFDSIRISRTQHVPLKPRLPSKVNTLISKDTKLPRVSIVSIGIGESRNLGIEALSSAYRFFGSDCIPSFHLLTDDTSGVDEILNPTKISRSATVHGEAYTFQDVLEFLHKFGKQLDYFFFLSKDVRISQELTLADIAGGIVAVQHPMYPRFEWAWCDPWRQGAGVCQFPYERDARSAAYMPPDLGKVIIKGKYKWSNGRNQRYIQTTGWYVHSGFWGGRRAFIQAAVEEISLGILDDVQNGFEPEKIDPEKHWNHYIYHARKSPDFDTRILGHAFMYPKHSFGFGPWITDHVKPVMTLMTVWPWSSSDIIEIAAETSQCLDTFMKPKVGLYGCHHMGTTQGWHCLFSYDAMYIAHFYTSIRQISNGTISANDGSGLCLDGTNAGAGQEVKLSECDHDRLQLAKKWSYNLIERTIQNMQTGLCLDVVHDPPHKREPVIVSECTGNAYQRFNIIPLALLTCTHDWCVKN